MKNREVKFHLLDIMDCINKIEKFTNGMDLSTFVNDEKTIDAVIKNIIIIGEAARLVSEEDRAKYPEIEYRLIIGMRNILVHNYLGTDVEEVWKTAKEEIPVLREQIERILPKLG